MTPPSGAMVRRHELSGHSGNEQVFTVFIFRFGKSIRTRHVSTIERDGST